MTEEPRRTPTAAIEAKKALATANRQRIARALETLVRDGRPVNVQSVAREAGVSPDTVRRSGDLYDEVKHHRGQQTSWLPPTPAAGSVSAGEHAQVKARLSAALDDAADLRRQLSLAESAMHQALGTAGTVIDRETAAILEAENAELRVNAIELQERLNVLQAEHDSITGELTAAHEQNREYVRRLTKAAEDLLAREQEIVRLKRTSKS